MEGPDIAPAIGAHRDRWRPGTVWIEKVGFQLALIQEARRRGLPVRELERTKDKLGRALGATPLYERGCVYFPDQSPWLADFESELLLFPNGAHDDCVDVAADAANIAQGLTGAFEMVDPPNTPPQNPMREKFSDLVPEQRGRFNVPAELPKRERRNFFE